MNEDFSLNFEGVSEYSLHQFMVWCAMRSLMRSSPPNQKCIQALYIKQAWMDGTQQTKDLKRALKWMDSIAWGTLLGARWGGEWEKQEIEIGTIETTLCALSEDTQQAKATASKFLSRLPVSEQYNEWAAQAQWLDEARKDNWKIKATREREMLLDYLKENGDPDDRLLYAFGR